jgi:hypothetical protein
VLVSAGSSAGAAAQAAQAALLAWRAELSEGSSALASAVTASALLSSALEKGEEQLGGLTGAGAALLSTAGTAGLLLPLAVLGGGSSGGRRRVKLLALLACAVSLAKLLKALPGVAGTTSTPGATRADQFDWDESDTCLLEGGISLRDVNKRLQLHLPIDGPKTLNGLLLEILQDIPEASVSLKINDCVIEIVQVQNQAIKMVKLYRQ